MRTPRFCGWATGLAWLIFHTPAVPSGAFCADQQDEFSLQEALAGRESAIPARFTWAFQIDYSVTGRSMKCVLKRAGDMLVLERETTDGAGYDEAVDCIGSEYRFRLIRADSEGPWNIRALALNGDSSEPLPPDIGPFLPAYRYMFLFGEELVSGVALSELVASPKFSYSIEESAAERVRISFTFEEPVEKDTIPEVSAFKTSNDSYFFYNEGEIEFSRINHRWCVSKCDLKAVSRNGEVMRRTATSGVVNGNVGKLEVHDLTPVEAWTTVTTLGFSTAAADREFTLSAYGLPEPPGIGGRTTPLYLLLLAIGLALTTVGLFVRRLRRSSV